MKVWILNTPMFKADPEGWFGPTAVLLFEFSKALAGMFPFGLSALKYFKNV